MKVSQLSSYILLGLFLATGMGMAISSAQAAFPGKNGKILFVVSPSGDLDVGKENEGIWVSNPDGSDKKRLTNFNSTAAWSADGTKIAFSQNQAIWVMNADGSNQTQISPKVDNASFPAWSPDGTQIVFQGYTSTAKGDLYIINANGSGLRQLTKGSEDDGSPAWSPDGKTIAFHRGLSPNNPYAIYAINTDGSGLRPLTKNKTKWSSAISPNWSPDGKQLVYIFKSNIDDDYDLHVVNADGSNPRMLVDLTGYKGAPTWSPDGSKIMFTGRGSFSFINADGTGSVTPVDVRLAGRETPNDWQPLP